MNKEAQERIVFQFSLEAYRQVKDNLLEYSSLDVFARGSDIDWEAYFARKICEILGEDATKKLMELGYRKLPEGQPPLLSDNPYIYESEECRQHTAFDKGKRVQRKADIKWYGGFQCQG